jgi:signal transduction histidine kinase
MLRSSATPSPARASGPLRLEFRHAHPLTRFVELVVLAAVYIVAGKLGLRIAIVHPSASAVWAPTGIALAALLWRGPRLWPAIFAGAFIVNITTAGSIATSIGIAAGNTLEALVGAWLVSRFAGGAAAFERASDTARFALLAGVLSTALSATVGVTSLAVGGFARWDHYGSIWLTWWLGDMSGALVVAPALLQWARNRRIEWSRPQALEAAVLLAALIVAGAVVFGTQIPSTSRNHPLAFLCMPLLAWAAFRFSARIASAAIVVLTAVAVDGALRSAGAPQRGELNASLVLLQVFMSVAAFTTLTLAAVVAERRRVEDAIRDGARKLRETVTELEAFSHSISHDLRSPVGAVINYSAVIERNFGDRLDGECIRLLRRIRTSAESATALLDQLLQLGWADVEPDAARRVDMTSLARDVHGEFLAAAEEVGEIQFELDDLPPAWGSPALLRCVFRNLLGNAVKFTRGRPERRIRVGATAGDHENMYSVTDNGIGIAAQHREDVFLPFKRVAVTRQVEGSGLGLTIAAMIVRRHRGRIWAESGGASGARLCFTLPHAALPDEA